MTISFPKRISCAASLSLLTVLAVPVHAHEHGHQRAEWSPTPYAESAAHAPTPLPDRVVLTWSDDPRTTQSVTWRTDTSVMHSMAEIAVANANGRALEPEALEADTTAFVSDLNDAHYHTVTFQGLSPDTLYAYRVGDGVNWSEYFHFRTASARPQPFSFIYFGDAQNELKTHWSRVFREAFRDAPRAAFTLHAGDLINEDAYDAEWGEWHGAPAWVNGTVPVIASPGNHEYYRANPGPDNERYWNTVDGDPVLVDVVEEAARAQDGIERVSLIARGEDGTNARLVYNDDDKIIEVGPGVTELTGFSADSLLGTDFDKPPLGDRLRDPGDPRVSEHWRPQFNFPRYEDLPAELAETVYFIDYQGARFISLDSNRDRESQISWLRKVLENNPNRWTIVTFHHPIFSPARDRDNAELRALWKPVLDEYRVDLVLNGHDHTYARTGDVAGSVDGENVPTGYQQAYDPEIGTVYVVSVSGPKMYDITKSTFAKRIAENTQLYQIIDVNDAELNYRAYTATGVLYDAFSLQKREGAANRLVEALPPENRAP